MSLPDSSGQYVAQGFSPVKMCMDTKLIKKAASALKNIRDIEFAYIFGSVAKNGAGKAGDVDIGIYLKGAPTAEKRLDIQLLAAEKIEKIFGKRADVAILNTASCFLRHQVVKYGELLFERKHGLDNKFRFNMMTEYFDNLFLHGFFYSRLRKGWSHG